MSHVSPPLIASSPRHSVWRRLREQVFLWRRAGDAATRRALRMQRVEPDAEGLAQLRIRGLPGPLYYRPAPVRDERRTFWELFFDRPYDADLPFAFRNVLDLGANVGLYLAYLIDRGAPLERYAGVEADPATFFVLEKQAASLGVAGKACLMNVAASDREGVLKFDNSGATIFHGLSETGTLEVPAKPVAALLDAAGIDTADIMKLDIEGGEAQVVPDVANWAHRVKRIAAELHYDMDVAWLRRHLEPHGFRVFPEGVLFRGAVGAIREDVVHELPAPLRNTPRPVVATPTAEALQAA